MFRVIDIFLTKCMCSGALTPLLNILSAESLALPKKAKILLTLKYSSICLDPMSQNDADGDDVCGDKMEIVGEGSGKTLSINSRDVDVVSSAALLVPPLMEMVEEGNKNCERSL